MAATDRKPRDPAGSSRSHLIIGLLVLSLMLVLGLAWQAHQATTTHLKTATNVLREYATLVAEEYVRRTMGDVGYYGYYTYVNLLRRQAPSTAGLPFDLIEPAANSPEARASRLAQYVFYFDAGAADLNFAGETEPDAAVASHLVSFTGEFLRGPLPDAGFAINHAVISGAAHTFVVTRSDGENRALGFEVNRQELGKWLQQSFDKGNLLPTSLARGAITNEYVYLQFADNTGNALFETGIHYDPYLRISRSLKDEYNGIFRGHSVSASIDPDIAESLVIGGLPRSRLPLLIVVMFMTVGLLVAAIRQLQRERSIIRMRTNFVSEVSHELRTPLTQIRMFAETLLFNRARTDDERHRALEIINREAQRLSHLVENVLQFSNERNNKRELQTELQLLRPIVERVVEEFGPLSEQAQANILCHFAEDVLADVDADAVRQILVNLLDNAVKYGPARQTISVDVTQSSSRVRLAVTDEGPGVPLEEQERIWGAYYRLNRERRSANAGTGIGLAVVRELVALHGGHSWVESSNGSGSSFVVEFLLASQEQTPKAESMTAETSPHAEKPG